MLTQVDVSLLIMIIFCDASVVTERESGKSKGYGYVNFTQQVDYRKALDEIAQSKPLVIGQKQIFAKPARPRKFPYHNQQHHQHYRGDTYFHRNSKRESLPQQTAQASESMNHSEP